MSQETTKVTCIRPTDKWTEEYNLSMAYGLHDLIVNHAENHGLQCPDYAKGLAFALAYAIEGLEISIAPGISAHLIEFMQGNQTDETVLANRKAQENGLFAEAIVELTRITTNAAEQYKALDTQGLVEDIMELEIPDPKYRLN